MVWIEVALVLEEFKWLPDGRWGSWRVDGLELLMDILDNCDNRQLILDAQTACSVSSS